MHVWKDLNFAQVLFCQTCLLSIHRLLGVFVLLTFFFHLEVNNDKSFHILSFIRHTEKLNALPVTSSVVFNTGST